MPNRLVLQIVQKVQILCVRQAAVEMVLSLGRVDGQALLKTAPGLFSVAGVHGHDPCKVQKRLILREGDQGSLDPRLELGHLVLERQWDYEIIRLAARRVTQERTLYVLQNDRNVWRLFLGQTRMDGCQSIVEIGLVLLDSLLCKPQSQCRVAVAQGVLVQLEIDLRLGQPAH